MKNEPDHQAVGPGQVQKVSPAASSAVGIGVIALITLVVGIAWWATHMPNPAQERQEAARRYVEQVKGAVAERDAADARDRRIKEAHDAVAQAKAMARCGDELRIDPYSSCVQRVLP